MAIIMAVRISASFKKDKQENEGGIILNTINKKEANFENEYVMKEDDDCGICGKKSITL